jgi:transcriptional regulator with XRE-family HTH domain
MHGLKAHYLLKRNIDALLKARGQTRKDLAFYCRRTESWISKLFASDDKNVPLKYLDRIADFFGLATYQLFQPGITPLTERRTGRDRRGGVDRRLSRAVEFLDPTPSVADFDRLLRKLPPDEYRRWLRRAFGELAGVDRPRAGRAQPGPMESNEPPGEIEPRTAAPPTRDQRRRRRTNDDAP